jgi:hypothetical protein
VKFCAGGVHSLVHSELVQIGPVRRVERPTAVVFASESCYATPSPPKS